MKKKEKQKLHLLTQLHISDYIFIDSTDLLHISETNAADARTTHDCLIDLTSRLGLELKD